MEEDMDPDMAFAIAIQESLYFAEPYSESSHVEPTYSEPSSFVEPTYDEQPTYGESYSQFEEFTDFVEQPTYVEEPAYKKPPSAESSSSLIAEQNIEYQESLAEDKRRDVEKVKQTYVKQREVVETEMNDVQSTIRTLTNNMEHNRDRLLDYPNNLRLKRDVIKIEDEIRTQRKMIADLENEMNNIDSHIAALEADY